MTVIIACQRMRGGSLKVVRLAVFLVIRRTTQVLSV